MAQDRLGSYRVRIAGQELQVPDLETLLRLARDGQLGGSAEVRGPGSESWVPMATVLAAHGPRKDPWSAWDEAEQVDPKAIWAEFASPVAPSAPAAAPSPPGRAPEPDVEALPLTAVARVEVPEDDPTDPDIEVVPQRAPPPPPPPPPQKPADRMEPLRALPRRPVTDVPRPPAGKVIPFPPRASTGPRTVVDGPYALEIEDPVPLRPPQPPKSAPTLPPEPEADPSVRWWRLATLLLVGVFVLGLARWYVLGQARQSFPVTAAGPAPVEVVAPRPVDRAAMASPYASVEEQLRSLLPTETKEVRVETALEDALLVELRAMRVDVIKVEAPILTWTGRKSDVPERTEIRVHLRDDEDNLDWNLGAVGMVVGKYIQRYSLEVQRLDVVFEGGPDAPARIAITPESARQLYMERKSLLDFLKTR